MASSKHTIKINSINAEQEELLTEKITKNILDAIRKNNDAEVEKNRQENKNDK